MDNGGKSTISFLLGMIAGGIIGILYAPKSGSETRTDIQNYLKEAEKKLDEKKEEIKKASTQQFNQMKEEMTKAFEKEKDNFIKDAAKEIKKEKKDK